MLSSRGFSPVAILVGVLVVIVIAGGVSQIVFKERISPDKSEPTPNPSVIYVNDEIIDEVETSFPADWENPDEQYRQKGDAIYKTMAKKYPKDFNECVLFWRTQGTGSPEYLKTADIRKECEWFGNRKINEELTNCPKNGTIQKFTMCGDFLCKEPNYICSVKYENASFVQPTNYEDCIKVSYTTNDCEMFQNP